MGGGGGGGCQNNQATTAPDVTFIALYCVQKERIKTCTTTATIVKYLILTHLSIVVCTPTLAN